MRDRFSRVVLGKEDIDFLKSVGIDIRRVVTVADLVQARRIATKRSFIQSGPPRNQMIDQALAQLREWGVGARIERGRVGRVYVIKFANGLVGVRRFYASGRIAFINPEGFRLVKKPTKTIVTTIQKSLEPWQRAKRKILSQGRVWTLPFLLLPKVDERFIMY